MLRRMIGLVLGALSAGVMLVALTPSPASAAGPTVNIVKAKTTNWTHLCFGYTGTFRANSRVFEVDWDANGVHRECFGIGTNRTVYHTWPGAGGWRVVESPRPGLADDVFKTRKRSDGWHELIVTVNLPSERWISSNLASGYPWAAWIRCPAGYC